MIEEILRSWPHEVREKITPILEHGIENYCASGSVQKTDSTNNKKPLAALDFDNTCIYGDITELAFFHLIKDRRFIFSDSFWEIIPEESGRNSIRENLEACRHLEEPDIENDLAYQRYRYGLHSVYFDIFKREGMSVASRFAARAFCGFAPSELTALGRRIIVIEEAQPRHHAEIQDPDKNGPALYSRRGLRINTMMRDLILALQICGIETVLVTGSLTYLVASYAQQLGIRVDEILGTHLEYGEDGKFTDRLIEPAPIFETKVEAIHSKYGHSPVIAIGDSRWDVPMLACADKARIFISHNDDPPPDEIQSLGASIIKMPPCP